MLPISSPIPLHQSSLGPSAGSRRLHLEWLRSSQAAPCRPCVASSSPSPRSQESRQQLSPNPQHRPVQSPCDIPSRKSAPPSQIVHFLRLRRSALSRSS